MPKRTPLYDAHRAAGARMVDFGGYDMPVNYGSQIDEHHAVRSDAGMNALVIDEFQVAARNENLDDRRSAVNGGVVKGLDHAGRHVDSRHERGVLSLRGGSKSYPAVGGTCGRA